MCVQRLRAAVRWSFFLGDDGQAGIETSPGSTRVDNLKVPVVRSGIDESHCTLYWQERGGSSSNAPRASFAKAVDVPRERSRGGQGHEYRVGEAAKGVACYGEI